MAYYGGNNVRPAERLPVLYRDSLGDDLGAATTYAGFTTTDLSAYFGISKVAAQGLINLAAGMPVANLPDDQKAALAAINPARFKPGASGPNQGYGDIPWGMQHLNEHPKGSHVSGGVLNIVKNIGLNLATGGLYSIAKGALNVIQGGNLAQNVKAAVASQGIAGGILTPAVGVDKSLMIQGAVAGGALAKAAATGALSTPAATAAQVAIKAAPVLTTTAAPASVPSAPVQSGVTDTNPPATDAAYGPNLPAPIAQAGMFDFLGGMSPLALVALIGVPLLIQFMTNTKKGK